MVSSPRQGPTAEILGDEALMKSHRLELPFGFDPRLAGRA
jgi:cobalt/nickel transport system ATP-binding protein